MHEEMCSGPNIHEQDRTGDVNQYYRAVTLNFVTHGA